MFRFTIRDVLSLTVIVAIALAWAVDRYRLATLLDNAQAWRGKAGALEEILRDDGWRIEWATPTGEVCAFRNGVVNCKTAEFFQPSSSD